MAKTWATRLASALLALLLCPGAVAAQSGRVLLVLDASNSMWASVDGTEKIVVAREVLSRMLTDLPPDMEIGLAAYGHRREKDCDDIEILLPVGGHDRAVVARTIGGLQPRGMTPITAALERAVESLGTGGGPAHVVLVSDGKETCAGDPCALVRAIRERGVQVTVHVVGFDVTAEESEQLRCIADAGGGRYAGAANAADLAKALGTIRETVVEASAATAAPGPPPRAVPADRERPYWRIETETAVYDGHLASVQPAKDGLVIQLANDEAVNLGVLVFASESRERRVADAFFVVGRGRPCRFVASTPPFQVIVDNRRAGGIDGTFAGLLACPDNEALRVRGAFHLLATGRDGR